MIRRNLVLDSTVVQAKSLRAFKLGSSQVGRTDYQPRLSDRLGWQWLSSASLVAVEGGPSDMVKQISQVTHLLHSCVLVASSYHLIGSMQTNFETYYDNLSHEYHTESDHPTTGGLHTMYTIQLHDPI